MFEIARQGAVDVIVGDSPLSRDFIDPLNELLAPCLRRGQPRAVINLQQIPLIDSAGLELLLDSQDGFERRGGELKLAAANPLCQEILTVTEVGSRFEMFADTTAAVGSFVQ